MTRRSTAVTAEILLSCLSHRNESRKSLLSSWRCSARLLGCLRDCLANIWSRRGSNSRVWYWWKTCLRRSPLQNTKLTILPPASYLPAAWVDKAAVTYVTMHGQLFKVIWSVQYDDAQLYCKPALKYRQCRMHGCTVHIVSCYGVSLCLP